jgi:hypothetical protein
MLTGIYAFIRQNFRYSALQLLALPLVLLSATTMKLEGHCSLTKIGGNCMRLLAASVLSAPLVAK